MNTPDDWALVAATRMKTAEFVWRERSALRDVFAEAMADARREALEECRAIAERKCLARTIGSFAWQTASDIEGVIRALLDDKGSRR
jgi:hypothetical protein